MINIETALDNRLWTAIQNSYEKENFTGAILDSIQFLGSLIREKSGLEVDGATLVGQAFGGDSPKLKVGKLQTESGRNVQAGVEQLFRGLYQAIRNPRSHDKYDDKQEDADAIILFVNYLLGIIDQAKNRFVAVEFLGRVFDKNFVEKERYAQLLVDDIPARNRLEIMLQVFADKEKGDGKKLKFFVQAIMASLSEDERNSVYQAVSDEFKVTNNEGAIRITLQIFPPDILPMLEEAARFRIENKLIESVVEGKYDNEKAECKAGALGTWAAKRMEYFLLKEELLKKLISKLLSTDADVYGYVLSYFWDEIVKSQNPPSDRLIRAIKSKLKEGNKMFYDQLKLEELLGDAKWVQPFSQEMETFKEAEPTESGTDDLPF